MTRGVRGEKKKCDKCGAEFSAMTRFFDRLPSGYLSAKCKWCRRGVKKQMHHLRRPKPHDVNGLRKCEGACAKFLPLMAEFFQPLPGTLNGGPMPFMRVCRKCRTSRGKRPAFVACRICGKSKPAADFDDRKDGYYRLACKTCRRIAIAEYRQTKRGRLALKRYRRSVAGVATDKRYKSKESCKQRKREQNDLFAASNPDRVKAYNKVAKALQRGKIAKPSICQGRRCKGRRLMAFFANGYGRPFDVIWLCAACHYERRKRAVRQINTDKEEWQRIHDQNVAKIAAEEAWWAGRMEEIAHLTGAAREREERWINVEYLYFECADRRSIAEDVLRREGYLSWI